MIDELNFQESKAVKQILSEYVNQGRSTTLSDLYSADFKQQPATIEEFLTDEDLLGKSGVSLYPFWLKHLKEIFAPGSMIQQVIVDGAIGGGKTTAAVIALLYKIYLLTLMKNPQSYFNLMTGTPIAFGLFSATVRLSDLDEFNILTGLMLNSPYFMRVSGMTSKSRNSDILKLPNNIIFTFGSRATHALGMNLLGGLMDETNWSSTGDNKQMLDLFNNTWRRIQSRFAKAVAPGLLILVSSKRSATDFTVDHIKRWGNRLDIVKTIRFALYEVKEHEFRSSKRFPVMVGDEVTPSRILLPDELPDPGFLVENVPEDFRNDFEVDIEGALRDISGILVSGESPLIPLRTKIVECIDKSREHPFSQETVIAGLRNAEEIQAYFDWQSVTTRKITHYSPRVHPEAYRYIHVDIGLSGDALGISMLHLSGSRKIITEADSGDVKYLDFPIAYIDLMLRVKASNGDQVDLGKLRRFILFLARHCNFNIKNISFDKFQSADSQQLLQKAGFETTLVSVDRNDLPYLALSQMIMNGNMNYYEYRPFMKELRELVHDKTKRKVDHPPMGSKDVGDAVCGALASALQDPDSYQLPGFMPQTDSTIQDAMEREHPGETYYGWIVGKYAKRKSPSRDYFRLPVGSYGGKVG
jgi:hypothetical protein